MGTMHVEGGKTHWVSCRPKICSSKKQAPVLEMTIARGGTIQVWAISHGPMSTAGVPRACTHAWGSQGMGIICPSAYMASSSRGFASGSADAAPAWNSVCTSVVGLQWFSLPKGKWNFRREAGCFAVQKYSGSSGSRWLQQHGRLLFLLTCGTLGSCVGFWKLGK